jgi:tRNA(fMet)-specific endonuclease VapC
VTYLLDTDTCIYWLRGHTPVRDRLLQVGHELVSISVITLAELQYGAAVSSRAEANRQAIHQFTTDIPVIGIDPAVATLFGSIKSELRKQGALLEDFDLLIAATARTHDLTLVTNNDNHFRRIPDLRLENWT